MKPLSTIGRKIMENEATNSTIINIAGTIIFIKNTPLISNY